MTESFATAAEKLLNKAAGLRVSESTARRTTEAVGTELGHRQQVGEVFGPARDWAWHKDADGKTCAYLSIDATGVRQRGPRGATAEGRMALSSVLGQPLVRGQVHFLKDIGGVNTTLQPRVDPERDDPAQSGLVPRQERPPAAHVARDDSAQVCVRFACI